MDSQEVTNLINDALKQMQQSRKVTPEEVNQFINSVDTNNDKKINRDELLQIFKKVVTQTKWFVKYIICKINISGYLAFM